MLPFLRPPASLRSASTLPRTTTTMTTTMMMMMMVVAMTGCAALLLPVPPLSRDPGPGVGGRYPPVPGGSSREGSSGGREEALDKLFSLRNSLARTLDSAFNLPPGRFYPTPSSRRFPPSCHVDDPEVIQQLFPGRFLSEFDLMQIVPRAGSWVSDSRRLPFRSQRRYVPGARDVQGAQASARGDQAVARDQQPSDQSAFRGKVSPAQFLADPGNSIPCGACTTEIGYEVVDTITDVTGRNHTVVNFKNAFQFIPSGRCVNELSSCGWGGWTCRQMTRAQWSLVWTAGTGVNLVAHEVPSHCECLNIGVSTPTLSRRQDRVAAAHSGADRADAAAVASDLKTELLLHGATLAEASFPQPAGGGGGGEGALAGEDEVQQQQKAETLEQTALPLTSGQPDAVQLGGRDRNQQVPRQMELPPPLSDTVSGSRKAEELELVSPLKTVPDNVKVGALGGHQEGSAKTEPGTNSGLLPDEGNSFAAHAGEGRGGAGLDPGRQGDSATKHLQVPEKHFPAGGGTSQPGLLRQIPFEVGGGRSGFHVPFIGEDHTREETGPGLNMPATAEPHVIVGVTAGEAASRLPQSSPQGSGQRQRPGLIIITEAPKPEVSRRDASNSASRSSVPWLTSPLSSSSSSSSVLTPLSPHQP